MWSSFPSSPDSANSTQWDELTADLPKMSVSGKTSTVQSAHWHTRVGPPGPPTSAPATVPVPFWTAHCCPIAGGTVLMVTS